MQENDIRDILTEIVEKRLVAQGSEIDISDANASLVDLGVMDSFGFLELVAELEEKTGVFPDFSEADPDEFTSINGLVKIVMENLV